MRDKNPTDEKNLINYTTSLRRDQVEYLQKIPNASELLRDLIDVQITAGSRIAPEHRETLVRALFELTSVNCWLYVSDITAKFNVLVSCENDFRKCVSHRKIGDLLWAMGFTGRTGNHTMAFIDKKLLKRYADSLL